MTLSVMSEVSVSGRAAQLPACRAARSARPLPRSNCVQQPKKIISATIAEGGERARAPAALRAPQAKLESEL
jgi:hypothetical protein